jgi:large subunit ribosomal protein LP2
MRHLATYLLLRSGGNANPTAADITKALEAVGVASDADRINALLAEVEGKDLAELIASSESLLFVGGGGGGGASAAAAPAGAAPKAAAPAVKEKPKEVEVDPMEGGMDMFGGGGKGGGDY